jgi:hypothetical protein
MIKQKLEKIFLNRLSILSTRAKFILAKYQLDNFENFFRFFVIEDKRMNFYSIKECGDKAAAELTSLVRAAAGTNKRSIARKSKKRVKNTDKIKRVSDF